VVLRDGTLVATFSARTNESDSLTASSGVFKYNPSTNSWNDRSDSAMRYWTMDIVIAPYDTIQNTWYAGVYSGQGNPKYLTGGLYRTTNRGTTWKILTDSLYSVHSITFNPTNIDQAYVTTLQGLWMTNNIRSDKPIWRNVKSYPFRNPIRVFFNPFDPNEIWVTSYGGGLMVGKIDKP
jgi:hypothetical protein